MQRFSGLLAPHVNERRSNGTEGCVYTSIAKENEKEMKQDQEDKEKKEVQEDKEKKEGQEDKEEKRRKRRK